VDFLDEAGAAVAWLQRINADESVQDQQITFVTKDCGRRQISWTFMRENNTVYSVGRDITDQRISEIPPPRARQPTGCLPSFCIITVTARPRFLRYLG
jgi:hypothetical protein